MLFVYKIRCIFTKQNLKHVWRKGIKLKGRFFDPWILITLISVCAPGLTLKTLKENVD